METPPVLGITHGDINGISYEIILKVFQDRRMLDFCTPIIYGSIAAMRYHQEVCHLSNIKPHFIQSLSEVQKGKLHLLDVCGDNIQVQLGRATEISGRAAFMALERAVADSKEQRLDALVTAPLSKETLLKYYENFSGHTEYLAERLGKKGKSLMVMVSEDFKLALFSTHLPLKEVASSLTQEALLDKFLLLHKALSYDFFSSNPHIAVMSLNPHSGEKGTLGREEIEIISPAIEEANRKGMLVSGPFSADGLMGSGEYAKFQAVLAMYHDQGMIPFKMLFRDRGVNVTVGLPLVRTSPAHGTAFDIAGRNIASCTSFREAIFKASELVKSRKRWQKRGD